jgi:uncharacterized membrane protein
MTTATTAHPERQTAPGAGHPSVDGQGPATGSARPAVARDVVPVAAAAGLAGAGVLALRRADPPAALRAARFLNLLLASLLTGNGAGSERFVHPALRGLPPRTYLEAEQAITRRYPGPMLALMPASIASGLLVLALLPRRRGRAFWLTLAGTLAFAGVLATTLAELPLNRQTLQASPDAPEAWLRERPRWDRFNRLRTLLEVGGWSLLCWGALTDDSRGAGGSSRTGRLRRR